MPYTQVHVTMQYVQPHVTRFCDPNQQQPCVPQQTQQLQQGTSFYNQIPQVQSQNHYTIQSNYIHPTGHKQYATSFPALPERLSLHGKK